MKLNHYTSHKTKTVLKTIDTITWINLIRDSPYKSHIIEGAPFKFIDREIYAEYKAGVPCITPNFLYDRKKEDVNIIKPTGLLYIDIDYNKKLDFQFDPQILDKSKIYSFFKTFSGLGYGILVKVNGLTKNNYDSTFSSICNELNIIKYIDKGAKKASQFLALSYDPNIFFNPDSFIFSCVEKLDNQTAPLTNIIKKEKKTYTIQGGTEALLGQIRKDYQHLNKQNKGLRFDNLSDVVEDFEDRYHVNWQGYEYVRAWFPYKVKIKEGSRYASFMSVATNLVWLNPEASYEQIVNYLRWANKKYCEMPMHDDQLIKITKSVLKMQTANKLFPITYWRKKEDHL